MLDFEGTESIVDENTWNDLEFDSIFAKIDRNISGIGQQYLYRLLHKYESDENILKQRFGTVSYLKGNKELREKIPFYSNPTFNDSDAISFQNLYHPLLQVAVPNTVESIMNSVLITGSNMSGKTTFIKTVGINFILSQSLFFRLSKEIFPPKLIIKSAIRRNEDLEEGKSYFFVEIETLNNFIKLSEKKNKYLFLIDEIFRGTNTIERLASSTAVLKYLDMNN